MDIDERLERLKQRQEVLRRRVERLTQHIQELRASTGNMAGATRGPKGSMQEFMRDIVEGTARLLHISQTRMTRLEGGE